MTTLKAVIIDQYGTTIRAKIGEYDRIKKTLQIEKYLYYNTEKGQAKYIKSTAVHETIKFNNPRLFRTDFKSEELKNRILIEE